MCKRKLKKLKETHANEKINSLNTKMLYTRLFCAFYLHKQEMQQEPGEN